MKYNNAEELAAGFEEASTHSWAVVDAHQDHWIISCTEDGDVFAQGLPFADEDGSNHDHNTVDIESLPDSSFPMHDLRLADAFSIDARHLTRQRQFSQRTFGPGERLAAVLDHIRIELLEVEAEPKDVTEWADLVILAFDGALRQGLDPQWILDSIEGKQIKNEERVWPDWRTQPTDKAIEHVREADHA